jgi:hypothetical protein
MQEDFTGAMEKCLNDYLIEKEIATVKVEKQYADLYQCEDGLYPHSTIKDNEDDPGESFDGGYHLYAKEKHQERE